MEYRHIFLAVLMALAWGANFSFMKIGLMGNSSFLFSAFRSILVLPLLLFVPRPKLPWKTLVLMGLLIGVCKLPLMLFAISLGVPPGISSLLSQSQVIFTVLLALWVFKEKPRLHHWVGIFIAFMGIILITVKLEITGSGTGLFLVFISAFSWAVANIATQKHKSVNMVHLTVWMNIVPPLPLILFTGFAEGWEMVTYPFVHFSWITLASVLYASLIAGVFGYSCWGYLLKHYRASQVSPFALLVPVFSVAIAHLILGETLTPVTFMGATLVLIGLGINQLKFQKKIPI